MKLYGTKDFQQLRGLSDKIKPLDTSRGLDVAVIKESRLALYVDDLN
ncbi:hypothetical protein VaK_0001 [Vibrio phage VaK]|nr:hypothetical protein VaK_0001 [Vibrio phage VaK]